LTLQSIIFWELYFGIAVTKFLALLPDGRIFGQITQNRPQEKFLGRENLVAGQWPILSKSGRKEAEKSFIKIYKGNSLWYAVCYSRTFQKF
jgi:hypothetical protein